MCILGILENFEGLSCSQGKNASTLIYIHQPCQNIL